MSLYKLNEERPRRQWSTCNKLGIQSVNLQCSKETVVLVTSKLDLRYRRCQRKSRKFPLFCGESKTLELYWNILVLL